MSHIVEAYLDFRAMYDELVAEYEIITGKKFEGPAVPHVILAVARDIPAFTIQLQENILAMSTEVKGLLDKALSDPEFDAMLTERLSKAGLLAA